MGFSEISNLAAGKAAHALCIRHSLELELFHCNTLMGMYGRFGDPSSALRVFEGMPLRNSASWNAAVSCCVRAGLFSEAAGLFREMQSRGVKVNGFVVAGILSACSQSAEMAGHGAQIHGLICKTGLLRDVFVGTALLHLYGSCGLVADVERLFPEMPEKNVVSWTAFMAALSKNGHPERAMRAFQLMRGRGTVANENSFATAVSVCAVLEDERLALEVLAQIVVSGCESSVSVGNSLISMFGRLGKMENAEFIFWRMSKRDKITWNSIISVFSHDGFCEEALWLFQKMRRSGAARADSTTLCSLISSCQSAGCLKWGRTLHALVLKDGLCMFVPVANTLVNMYSLCGSHEESELLFDDMPERDLISWNCMMASHLTSGQGGEALNLLSRMIRARIEVNHVTLASALSACSCPEALRHGRAVHALVAQAGLQENLLVANALITMYGNCESMAEARQVFRALSDPDVISWNALMGGLAENRQTQEAMELFNAMRRAGAKANHITMTNALGACSSSRDLSLFGAPLHGLIISAGFESDGSVRNSVLTAYSKGGDLHSSSLIFDGLELPRNLVSWNVMIFARAHHGLGEDALKLFMEVLRGGHIADQFTLSGGLAACSSLALLQEGQQLHGLIIKLGFVSNLHVANATMDMYGKCGKMDDALKLLAGAARRCRQTWNILLSSYARHGRFREARAAFLDMLQSGQKPDQVTFVSLLSACSHGGLVDEGLSYFSSMASQFGVPQGIEHCVCVVDLLGRAGRLAEAENFVEKMPVAPNDLIWRSLLSSSRIHGEVGVGRRAAQRLLERDPMDDSAYVLLSNVYASSGSWGDAEKVRAHMESIRLRKKPACSWIRVKNSVNVFGIDDRVHPQGDEIRAKLEEILSTVKDAGYVADTRFVFHDTDEEQKEHSLWAHSEKLALAFGLLTLPGGSTITVFKNLRVCGDCHLVFKLVSGALGREIVLRDSYRFHHFAGGTCSCSDYW